MPNLRVIKETLKRNRDFVDFSTDGGHIINMIILTMLEQKHDFKSFASDIQGSNRNPNNPPGGFIPDYFSLMFSTIYRVSMGLHVSYSRLFNGCARDYGAPEPFGINLAFDKYGDPARRKTMTRDERNPTTFYNMLRANLNTIWADGTLVPIVVDFAFMLSRDSGNIAALKEQFVICKNKETYADPGKSARRIYGAFDKSGQAVNRVDIIEKNGNEDRVYIDGVDIFTGMGNITVSGNIDAVNVKYGDILEEKYELASNILNNQIALCRAKIKSLIATKRTAVMKTENNPRGTAFNPDNPIRYCDNDENITAITDMNPYTDKELIKNIGAQFLKKKGADNLTACSCKRAINYLKVDGSTVTYGGPDRPCLYWTHDQLAAAFAIINRIPVFLEGPLNHNHYLYLPPAAAPPVGILAAAAAAATSARGAAAAAATSAIDAAAAAATSARAAAAAAARAAAAAVSQRPPHIAAFVAPPQPPPRAQSQRSSSRQRSSSKSRRLQASTGGTRASSLQKNSMSVERQVTVKQAGGAPCTRESLVELVEATTPDQKARILRELNTTGATQNDCLKVMVSEMLNSNSSIFDMELLIRNITHILSNRHGIEGIEVTVSLLEQISTDFENVLRMYNEQLIDPDYNEYEIEIFRYKNITGGRNPALELIIYRTKSEHLGLSYHILVGNPTKNEVLVIHRINMVNELDKLLAPSYNDDDIKNDRENKDVLLREGIILREDIIRLAEAQKKNKKFSSIFCLSGVILLSALLTGIGSYYIVHQGGANTPSPRTAKNMVGEDLLNIFAKNVGVSPIQGKHTYKNTIDLFRDITIRFSNNNETHKYIGEYIRFGSIFVLEFLYTILITEFHFSVFVEPSEPFLIKKNISGKDMGGYVTHELVLFIKNLVDYIVNNTTEPHLFGAAIFLPDILYDLDQQPLIKDLHAFMNCFQDYYSDYQGFYDKRRFEAIATSEREACMGIVRAIVNKTKHDVKMLNKEIAHMSEGDLYKYLSEHFPEGYLETNIKRADILTKNIYTPPSTGMSKSNTSATTETTLKNRNPFDVKYNKYAKKPFNSGSRWNRGAMVSARGGRKTRRRRRR